MGSAPASETFCVHCKAASPGGLVLNARERVAPPPEPTTYLVFIPFLANYPLRVAIAETVPVRNFFKITVFTGTR